MGISGGFMDSDIEVGEMARLPDGTSAQVVDVDVEGDKIQGVHVLQDGKKLKFHTNRMAWLFLRQGIIPEQGGGS